MTLSKLLKAVIVIIILLRLVLTFLPSYKIDMNTWEAWTVRIMEVGPQNFYSPSYFADYFPGYLYMLWFIGSLFLSIFPNLSIYSLNFEYYLKTNTFIFDILTAFNIFKIVSAYNKRWGLVAIILYLANPALSLNSSVMGQVDGILTFFLVYSTYCLFELKRPLQWSITSAIALLIKPQGLAIFPVSFIYLLKNFPSQKFSSLIIPIIMIVFSVPFFIRDPVLGLFHLLQRSANVYPYTSIFSYNFWSFSGFWVSDSLKFVGVTYQFWGLIFFCISLILVIFPLLRQKKSINPLNYYLAMALSSMAFFLFLTRMHQRYLFPFFAFFLIVVVARKSVKLLIIYLTLSLIHFANLWYVYYYYNYVYPNPTLSVNLIFKFLETNHNIFTVVNLLGWGYLLKYYYAKKTS